MLLGRAGYHLPIQTPAHCALGHISVRDKLCASSHTRICAQMGFRREVSKPSCIQQQGACCHSHHVVHRCSRCLGRQDHRCAEVVVRQDAVRWGLHLPYFCLADLRVRRCGLAEEHTGVSYKGEQQSSLVIFALWSERCQRDLVRLSCQPSHHVSP
jgi:hypothetical protein